MMPIETRVGSYPIAERDVGFGIRPTIRSKTEPYRRLKAEHLGVVLLHDLFALALQPVAIASEQDDLGLVLQAVDHRGDGTRTAEDSPEAENVLFELTTRDGARGSDRSDVRVRRPSGQRAVLAIRLTRLKHSIVRHGGRHLAAPHNHLGLAAGAYCVSATENGSVRIASA
jgi:hypothetical protein